MRTDHRERVGNCSKWCWLVDLRREFENPGSALKTVALRRSRGVYKRDRRPSEPTVVDSRGRMVRAVGMAQTFLKPEQVDELVALYQQGWTLVKLAERFGIHKRTAAAHLVRRSVPLRGKGLGEEDRAEAVQLYVEYNPAPPFNAGSPKTAPPAAKAFLDDMFGPLVDTARATAQRAQKRLG